MIKQLIYLIFLIWLVSLISDMRDAFHKPVEKKDYTKYYHKSEYTKEDYTRKF